MLIEQAKALKVNDRVSCPEDRGTAAFTGLVVRVSRVRTGVDHVWVTVKRENGFNAGVWPSSILEAL